MPTFEIPREHWVDQLNAFTTVHEGWLVSLDVFGPDVGSQPEIDDLPLLGISAERVNHDGTIAVSVARSIAEHFTHIIRGVVHIYVKRTGDGTTATLLVESDDGMRTLLRFRAAALPIAATSS